MIQMTYSINFFLWEKIVARKKKYYYSRCCRRLFILVYHRKLLPTATEKRITISKLMVRVLFVKTSSYFAGDIFDSLSHDLFNTENWPKEIVKYVDSKIDLKSNPYLLSQQKLNNISRQMIHWTGCCKGHFLRLTSSFAQCQLLGRFL